jgi:hypothetical protein
MRQRMAIIYYRKLKTVRELVAGNMCEKWKSKYSGKCISTSMINFTFQYVYFRERGSNAFLFYLFIMEIYAREK